MYIYVKLYIFSVNEKLKRNCALTCIIVVGGNCSPFVVIWSSMQYKKADLLETSNKVRGMA